jgi:hypothetical protein
VALHEVSAQPVLNAKGQLEVDGITFAQLSQGTAAERLCREIGLESALVDPDRRETDAVDEHRVTVTQFAGERSIDLDARPLPLQRETRDRAELLY